MPSDKGLVASRSGTTPHGGQRVHLAAQPGAIGGIGQKRAERNRHFPHQLELEITESFVMLDPERSFRTLAELKAMGVRLSIDDFGTGYFSLSYLQQLEVHKLKIDMSFVRGMTRNSGKATIVRAVIAMGHSLGLEVIAEGVENLSQARQLRALTCDVIQGYLVSHPLPTTDITELLGAFTPLDTTSEDSRFDSRL